MNYCLLKEALMDDHISFDQKIINCYLFSVWAINLFMAWIDFWHFNLISSRSPEGVR